MFVRHSLLEVHSEMRLHSRSSSFFHWGHLEVSLSGCKGASYTAQGFLQADVDTVAVKLEEEVCCQSTPMLIAEPDVRKRKPNGSSQTASSLQLARIRWVILSPVSWRSCAVCVVMVLNCYIVARWLTSFQQESIKSDSRSRSIGWLRTRDVWLSMYVVQGI